MNHEIRNEEPKKGSPENPFFIPGTMEQVLELLMHKSLQLPADGTAIFFKWQGGVYGIDAGCKIGLRQGSPETLEVLREKMNKILGR